MILAAWYHGIAATLFALLAIFLMLLILLQRGKGVGLAGAFGGSATNTAFGSKTGDVLTWATVVLASVFLLLAVGLNHLFVPQGGGLRTPAPVVQPAGPTAAGAPATPTPTEEDELSRALAGETPSASTTIPPTEAADEEAAPETTPETGSDEPAAGDDTP